MCNKLSMPQKQKGRSEFTSVLLMIFSRITRLSRLAMRNRLSDDDKSSLFSHDQRLAQGEENYESYVICRCKTFSLKTSSEALAMA